MHKSTDKNIARAALPVLCQAQIKALFFNQHMVWWFTLYIILAKNYPLGQEAY